MHLVLFYLRTRSLWTGKVYNTTDFQNLTNSDASNFKFGLYEELFDDFNFIRPIRNVPIPGELSMFYKMAIIE